MFLMHCSCCDHEWQSFDEEEPCSWCGRPGVVLQETRPEDDWETRLRKAQALIDCVSRG